MGAKTNFKCNACGHEFIANVGNGMFSKTLHCAKCGAEKAVGMKDDYGKLRHECGGAFSESAIICPQCRSRDVVPLGILGYFD